MSVTTNIETLPIYIDGSFRQARSGETIDATNPASGEVIARFPRCDSRDVDDAVVAAEAAFTQWRATPALERANMVRELADRIEEHADELAMLDVHENGSPIREMRADAFAGAAALRYFAGLALELRGETIPSDFDRLDYTIPSPFGVVGRIIPFNHPFMFAASKSAAPLIAGNALILKPSEHTSMSTIRLAELANGVLPKGSSTSSPARGWRRVIPWSSIPVCAGSLSRARPRSAARSSSGRRPTWSKRSASSSGARTRSWSCPTPTWTSPSKGRYGG